MTVETFDTPEHRYICATSYVQGDACIIRHRRGTNARKNQWTHDHSWYVHRYPTYEDARTAALTFVADELASDAS